MLNKSPQLDREKRRVVSCISWGAVAWPQALNGILILNTNSLP
jgi:hypothetical protein